MPDRWKFVLYNVLCTNPALMVAIQLKYLYYILSAPPRPDVKVKKNYPACCRELVLSWKMAEQDPWEFQRCSLVMNSVQFRGDLRTTEPTWI
jgi:hypothetical protein